jgi:cell volume regulation protein A
MAVFLTMAMITLIQNASMSPIDLLPMFIRQMSLGAAFGYGMGVVLRVAVNRLHLDYHGLYPSADVGAGALDLFGYRLVGWQRISGPLYGRARHAIARLYS